MVSEFLWVFASICCCWDDELVVELGVYTFGDFALPFVGVELKLLFLSFVIPEVGVGAPPVVVLFEFCAVVAGTELFVSEDMTLILISNYSFL